MSILITSDRYEGLDPQIAEALKNGRKAKGKAWDDDKPIYAELIDYVCGQKYPYICIIASGERPWYKHFTPIYEEETDWSKVEMDAKIIVTDGRGIQKRYFHHYDNYIGKRVWFYPDGSSSWSNNNSDRTVYASADQCRLAKEGE
jgi:hypothetical protein